MDTLRATREPITLNHKDECTIDPLARCAVRATRRALPTDSCSLRQCTVCSTTAAAPALAPALAPAHMSTAHQPRPPIPLTSSPVALTCARRASSSDSIWRALVDGGDRAPPHRWQDDRLIARGRSRRPHHCINASYSLPHSGVPLASKPEEVTPVSDGMAMCTAARESEGGG